MLNTPLSKMIDRFKQLLQRSYITKNTYSVTMSDTVDGRQIYCIVTDAKGNTVQTNTVTLWKKTSGNAMTNLQ